MRRMRLLRTGLGWSQEKVGVAIGIEESSARARISRYELGVHEPPLPTVKLLAAAFGVGTLPVMVALTWAGQRIGHRLQHGSLRIGAGVLVIAAGLLTLVAPWLVQLPAMHGVLQALGCRSLPG